MGRGDLKSASRFGDVVALCDVDVSHAAAVAKQYLDEQDAAGAVHRLPPGARSQGRRHHHQRHARSLAHADQPGGGVGEEGHLRGEAAHADHRRRQAGGQGGAQGEGRAADRHPAAQQQAVPAGVRAGAQRADRQAHAGDGLRAGGPARGTVHAGTGAGRLQLGLLARPGAEGGLPEGAHPLDLPLVVRLLRRPGHRLGRAPQRHRPLGHRPRRPARRAGAGA